MSYFGEEIIRDASSNKALVSSTGGLKIIDAFNYNLGLGNAYLVSHVFTSVANLGTADFLVILGASKTVKISAAANVGGNCYFNIYEGTTVSANGTAFTPVNKDRNSLNTASTAFYYTPTVTAVGTMIDDQLVPGGVKSAGSGGGFSSENDWSFKKSTTYLVRVTNVSGGATDIGIDLVFYEI